MMSEATAGHEVPRPVILGFSIGSLGTGIFSVTPSALLLYFMTDILGIAAALAALAVALPKLWDVVTDPVMGMITDRTRSRWGRRRPYLLLGAVLMSVSFVFLFSVPESLTVSGRFWYVFAVFTLSATAYTIFAVPYVTMPVEMSADTHERTVIMTYRMAFSTAGLLIGAAGAPLLVDWFGGGRQGYASMSYVVGGFCAAAMLVAVFSTRSVKATAPTPCSLPAREQLRLGLRNRPFFVLLSAYFVQLAGLATFLAAAPFFTVYVTGAGAGAAGLIFMCLMGSGLVSMPLWAWLSPRLGKLRCYMAAVVLYALVSFGFAFIDGPGTGALLYTLCLVLGMPFGCIMMMPFSMLTDAVRFDGLRTGLHREGVFTGLWTAGEKSGLAVGPMAAGIILGLFGFAEAAGGAAAAQAATAVWGIRVAFAIAPGAIVLGSLLILRRYELDENQLARDEMAAASR